MPANAGFLFSCSLCVNHMYSVTLSPCDGDAQVCGFTQDFDTLEAAQACFNDYNSLSHYDGEPFDLFLDKDGSPLFDNIKS